MKKIFFLLFVYLIASCSDMTDTLSEMEINDENKSEKYEYLTLQDGTKLLILDDSTYVYQGDILMTKEDVMNYFSFDDFSKDPLFVELRGTITNSTLLYWPSGKIPYRFESGVPETDKSTIESAMRRWEQRTTVKFVERTNERKFVKFEVLDAKDKAGGYSTIGYSSDPKIQLKAGTQFQTVVHELGHTIGLIHEHQRVDRDDHIEILRNKIQNDFLYAFDIRTASLSPYPFDFNSVMLYRASSFPKVAGATTIVARNGDNFPIKWDWAIPSIYDYEIVNHIYKNRNYYSTVLTKPNAFGTIQYTITYPQTIDMGDDAIITVKTKVLSGSSSGVTNYYFNNPNNGYITSTTNIMTGNDNIITREYIYRPVSKGTAQIKTNFKLSPTSPDYISIIVK